ncbi:hypothetical protein [Nocardia rhizosphaerihabitans]|uniref:hypothetical protein n=1 Tax=Nocardia rhizosphaerihabitans TaxID=1691570 RepID=UPI001E52E347|nr:hypothetical protein [Nocardia rhizosphaerihabitans]
MRTSPASRCRCAARCSATSLTEKAGGQEFTEDDEVVVQALAAAGRVERVVVEDRPARAVLTRRRAHS